jgi:hypothetical protein
MSDDDDGETHAGAQMSGDLSGCGQGARGAANDREGRRLLGRFISGAVDDKNSSAMD